MVRQHDAARANTDRACPASHIADHDRRGGTGNPDHVVVLRQPEAAIPEALDMSRQLDGIPKRVRGRAALRHKGEIKD
jgi:hypothetical protein